MQLSRRNGNSGGMLLPHLPQVRENHSEKLPTSKYCESRSIVSKMAKFAASGAENLIFFRQNISILDWSDTYTYTLIYLQKVVLTKGRGPIFFLRKQISLFFLDRTPVR